MIFFNQNHLLASRRRGEEDQPTWRARSSLASSPRRVPGVSKSWRVTKKYMAGWWFGTGILFFHIYIYICTGMSSSSSSSSSSQLMNSYFSEGYCRSTTNQLGLEMGMMGMLPWHFVNGVHDDQPVHGMGATMFSEKPSFIKFV